MTRTVFRGGSVFDGTGARPAPADVAIEDGRIVDVGTGLDGDEVVEAAGRTILPGLFDAHVHVVFSHVDAWKLVNTPFSYVFYEAARNLRDTLRIGITSVRDAGGADLGIKQAVADGLIPGPRMQISLAMMSQTGGHGDDWLVSGVRVPLIAEHPGVPSGIADGPDEVRRKVRELHGMGADVIKVATSGGVLSPRDDPRHAHYRPAELEVLVEEATAAGMFVMAHAQGADGIKNAIRAGIRSIEHGIFLDDEGIELMLRHGTWLVPTLVAPQGVIDAAAAGVVFSPGVLEKATSLVELHRVARAPGDRGRRAGGHGHRLGRGAARAEPARARPHGRPRDGAGAPCSRQRPGARPSCWAWTTCWARSSPASSPISSSWTVTRSTFDTLADRIAGVWVGGRRAV